MSVCLCGCACADTLQLTISLSCVGILTWACYSTHLKYFVDFKTWTQTRVTGLTTALTSARSTASKQSSRPSESESVHSAEPGGNASRF